MADEPQPTETVLAPPASLPPQLLLSAIVDSSDDAIVSKNLHGIITSWNKGAERIFGYSAEEITGRPITCLIPPDRQDEEPRILDRLTKGERVDHFETVRLHKTGRHIDVSLSISPVRDASGCIIGASKIARDISEQKRVVRALTQAHLDLKRADHLKLEFIATLSHELRTPLNAIIGWVQILKGGSVGSSELQEGVAVIERNARAQARMIEDLLDMSRIESGKLSLDVERVDLAAVLGSAIESIRHAADARQIRLHTECSNVGGVVMGDRNRLQQVVWNLLSNAIKFTPSHGRVQVTIERVNGHATIAVSDTGVGIAPEFIDHVFERFRQADSSTTRQHGGLGLGLTIVKQLVELHGGEVRVTSPGVGQGSTFIVSLPLMATPHHPRQASVQAEGTAVDELGSEADLTGIRVLAVDDEPDCVTVVQRILEARNAQVRTAQSVGEALDVFKTFQPDLVLSDIGMPGQDGYDLVAGLRAIPGSQMVPMVAITALARAQDRTNALRAGFQMHLVKPVDAAELVAVVMNLAAPRRSPAEPDR